jgi:hypothetical protein
VCDETVTSEVHIIFTDNDHWGDPGVVGRIILKWIFRK